MTLFVLLIVGGAVWMIAAPGARFLPHFGALLTAPRIERGPLSFFSGRSFASGEFDGRDVMVRLQRKRSRYGQGYLVVALRLEGVASLGGAGIDERTQDDAGRRALAVLARHDVQLSIEQGWLKALWQPQGLMIFPGPFSADKWRHVLDGMRTVAGSIEGAA